MFSPEFMRSRPLYLAELSPDFVLARLRTVQIVFARTDCRQIPWTRRAPVYKDQNAGAGDHMDACDVLIVGAVRRKFLRPGN